MDTTHRQGEAQNAMAAEHSPLCHSSTQNASTLAGDKIEPIAIIGMSIRLPQGNNSMESFWETLMEGKSTWSKVPSDRYSTDAFPHLPRGGHFIDRSLGHFDAAFFSMASSEAEALDPQQRWLLETTYEAIENAGMSLESIAGTRTSVHVSSAYHDWENMVARDPTTNIKTKATAASSALLANRLSWFYNLTGPSCSIDTACSGGLYGLHQACQSLRLGDSSMGIVCGCNLVVAPDASEALGSTGALSEDGVALPFDIRANGYARGDAFAVVLIKPLRHALRDGDTIRAVIRGTTANQNGRTSSIGQPSVKTQEDLIRQTYISAGLDIRSTYFFEAHGTGTPIGDLAEVRGIANVFEKIRSPDSPLIIGATKALFGHSEAASGLVGLIKSVLVLERSIIPGNKYIEKLISELTSPECSLKLPKSPIAWPQPGLRRASVSSFGYGGLNVHAIIDDALHYLAARGLSGLHRTIASSGSAISQQPRMLTHPMCHSSDDPQDFAPRLLVWSAADMKGVSRLTEEYAKHFEKQKIICQSRTLVDLAYTLSEKRSRLPWKNFTVARSVEELSSKPLHGLQEAVRSSELQYLGFIFTGQGAQWLGMGQELMAYGEYSRTIRLAEQVFRSLGSPWSLTDALLGRSDSIKLSEPHVSQPVTTVLQIALVNLLRSWSIHPKVVIGHSSGEIAAAYSTGSLSLVSALRVAYYRGLVATDIKNSSEKKMGMMSVGLSQTQASERLTQCKLQDRLTIACINSNANVTISGEVAVLEILQKFCQVEGIFCRILNVKVAYHSPYPGNIGGGSSVSMISTVTGQVITPTALCEASYWSRNLQSPVLFYQAMSGALLTEEHRKIVASVEHWIELGPHSILQGPVRQTMSQANSTGVVRYGSVLQRNREADVSALSLAGNLYSLGYQVDIRAVNNRATHNCHRSEQMLTDLPPYPFNYSKVHWLESRISKNYRLQRHAYNPYLGSRVLDWNPLQARWRNRVSVASHPWLKDHKLNGMIVLPGTSMLVSALEGAVQISSSNLQPISYRLKGVSIKRAVILRSEEDEVELELCLIPEVETSNAFLSWAQFQLFLHEKDADNTAVAVCSGFVTIEYERLEQTGSEGGHVHPEHVESFCSSPNNLASKFPVRVKEKDFYRNAEWTGFTYGPSFAQLRDIYHDNFSSATAELDLHAWRSDLTMTAKTVEPSVIHPAAFDAVLQLSFACKTFLDPEDRQYGVPTAFSEICIFNRGATTNVDSSSTLVQVYSSVKQQGPRKFRTSFQVNDKATSALAIIGEFEATKVDAVTDDRSNLAIMEPLTFRVDWKPDLDLMTPEMTVAYCRKHAHSPHYMELTSDVRLYCHSKIVAHILEISSSSQKQGLSKTNQSWSAWAHGMLPRLNSSELQHALSLSLDPCRMSDLEQSIETSSAIGQLVVRVGQSLSGLLSGDLDVLEVFFGDKGLVEETYVCGNDLSTPAAMAQTYLTMLGFKQPAMRIIEIGAGSGSFTRLALKSLSNHIHGKATSAYFGEYLFTDVSSTFFESAKELFSDFCDRLKFAPLDIAKDLSSQGFGDQVYDLVIASGVIHATADVNASLRNVHKLLKPGGKLLLVEATEPDAMLQHFLFGLLDGWWLGTEPHRSSGPLMNANQWHSHLVESGFSGVEILFGEDDGRYDLAEWGRSSAIVSTKIEDQDLSQQIGGKLSQSYPRAYIVYDDSSELQTGLASLVKERITDILPQAYCVPLTQVDKIEENELCGSLSVFLPELERPIIHELSLEGHKRIQTFVSSVDALLWIKGQHSTTFDCAASALVDGIRNSVSRERTTMKFATLSLQGQEERSQLASNIGLLVHHLCTTGDAHLADLEFSMADGNLCIHRIVPTPATDNAILGLDRSREPEKALLKSDHARALKLDISAIGALDEMTFSDDDTHDTNLTDSEIEIEVEAVGINFKDVLTILGQVDSLNVGQECAGRVTRLGNDRTSKFRVGDRVCAILPEGGAFSTFARVDKRLVATIPSNVSFALAAALPVVFATAYYCLHYAARIRKDESILIHSAAGGLGQAIIQLVRLFDPHVTIFATVGTDEKRRYLTDRYGIPESHILSSRDPTFKDNIMNLTKGRGVDIAINHLSGEGLRCTWSCMAPLGRFVEVGRKDIMSQASLPMEYFAKGLSFSAVDLSFLGVHAPDTLCEVLITVVELLKDKVISTDPWIYGVSELAGALKLLQSGKSIGKLVIEMRNDDSIQVIPKKHPPCEFDGKATYIIAGGLGGLGRSIALWMASKGARSLVLLSRRGKDAARRQFFDDLYALGVNVFAPPCDICDRESLARVLVECTSTMPPIKGCINAAMDLQSGTFSSMSYEASQAVMRPKVAGSWNLHILLPPSLDFFIFLSSIMGIAGNHGQSHYAAANRFQDALAQRLVHSGDRPETYAIDLGGIEDAGWSFENGYLEKGRRLGWATMSEQQFHNLLGHFCNPKRLNKHPDSQIVTGISTPRFMEHQGIAVPAWHYLPPFSHIAHTSISPLSGTKTNTTTSYASRLREMTDPVQIGTLLIDAIRDRLAKILAVDVVEIDASKPINRFGIDSLGAVELRSWMSRELGCEVQALEILSERSVKEFGESMVAGCRFTHAAG